ncbi:HAD-IA family hydrolase [Ancylothrix sp. C2]|uniref:HAD-IA family hydrolase n=1 Tax=Ancylothrix sp. D3o TaxID=2953691 RepID=UPI0021BA4749|nr:HAD-IA family hydrolase [Ancylothrix sp. D3o]MCT7949248.1 HAD-IA family hydrolase [Ancylothrix sp. D3o]
MQKPKVIFLDAVGTLFGAQESIGELYAQVALQFGVDSPPSLLEKAFYKSFKSASPACFPGVKLGDISQQEFDWWYAVSEATFQRAGYLSQFANFDSFFEKLFDYFATAEPWFVYPDVVPALQKWQQEGIELGVISNFDSRLYQVLESLNLANYFSSVTISTQVGAAKPEQKVFATALEKHHCLALEACHIGDSFKEDYCGAKAAGLQAIWVHR